MHTYIHTKIYICTCTSPTYVCIGALYKALHICAKEQYTHPCVSVQWRSVHLLHEPYLSVQRSSIHSKGTVYIALPICAKKLCTFVSANEPCASAQKSTIYLRKRAPCISAKEPMYLRKRGLGVLACASLEALYEPSLCVYRCLALCVYVYVYGMCVRTCLMCMRTHLMCLRTRLTRVHARIFKWNLQHTCNTHV